MKWTASFYFDSDKKDIDYDKFQDKMEDLLQENDCTKVVLSKSDEE